jgi:hypothetical protein
MKLICELCGKEFEAKRKDAKYCSDSCRNKASRLHRGLIGKTCLICGEKFSPKTPSANKRKICYNCVPDGETITRSKYVELIKTKIYTGKCCRCGYDKCIQALEFHHIDPKQKDTIISSDSITIEKAIEESKKCILICSNCHKEFHAGLWDLSELNLEERKED